MEKTLSLGAFTELNETEVMETEGGSWFDDWEQRGADFYDATHNENGKFDIKRTMDNLNIVNATRNYITQFQNILRNVAMPKGIPNSNYDWTIY